MKNNSTLRNMVILFIVLALFIILYIVLDKVTNKNSEEYTEYLKNYNVNEYIPTYISDEDMARIYLNEFVHIMHYDVEESYNLLDEEYRLKKFSNIELYKTYINSIKYSTYKLDSYYVRNKDGYKIFGVYDTNGNLFIFKTKGVMQYTVYFDDDTVEI